MTIDLRGQLTAITAIRRYALAGEAVFTLESARTGNRLTFKVQQPDPEQPHFVKVLTGSNNVKDFTYLGTIFSGSTYRHGFRSRISLDALSEKVFSYFWRHLIVGDLTDELRVWHEGKCGRCGRSLTVPESIESGIGPVCESLL